MEINQINHQPQIDILSHLNDVAVATQEYLHEAQEEGSETLESLLAEAHVALQDELDRTSQFSSISLFTETQFTEVDAITAHDEQGNFTFFAFADRGSTLAVEVPVDPVKDCVILVTLDRYSGSIEYRIDSDGFVELSVIEGGHKQWIEDELLQFQALQVILIAYCIFMSDLGPTQ
mgnify:CR=1 FL=1